MARRPGRAAPPRARRPSATHSSPLRRPPRPPQPSPMPQPLRSAPRPLRSSTPRPRLARRPSPCHRTGLHVPISASMAAPAPCGLCAGDRRTALGGYGRAGAAGGADGRVGRHRRGRAGRCRAPGRSSRRSAPRCRTRRSAASMPAATSGRAVRAADRDLGRDEQALRAHVQRAQVDDALHLRARLQRGHDGPLDVSALADSPISRLFISTASTAATQPSSTPMASEPAPSQTPSPVITVSATPAVANTSPVSAAMSSSRMAGSSGALARRMNAVQLFRPRTSFVSCTAVRSEKLSRPIAMTSTTNATAGELIVLRVDDLVDALVHREHRAHGEQHHGDHERVEVPLPAEPERVLLGLLALRPAAAEQQQRLVAAVGQRVHRLGQHRGRAGDGERDQLDHRDAQVRAERGQHRAQPGTAGFLVLLRLGGRARPGPGRPRCHR